MIPGQTMAERREWFAENSDELRTLLMCEPRGHASMSGSILQPPTRSDADYGVLFIEVSGLLPMCGHGTIGTAKSAFTSGASFDASNWNVTSGGGGGMSATDNGNGTASITGLSITDNGNGTATIAA